MTKKVSALAAARSAMAAEKKVAKMAPTSTLGGATMDSFQNFAHKLGIGTDSPLSSVSYGFNPVTRIRQTLEFIYRGSWLGGMAVDIIADDMTRKGISFEGELPPDAAEKMSTSATRMDFWVKLNETIRWGRLYGGAIAVALLDGQDPRQPLNPQAVGPKQFKGLMVFDRWMLEPSLDDLVTEMGPHLGLPRYYRIGPNAPALRGQVVHHSRVILRHVAIPLPYQQALTEQLWGISVLERIWDRMVMFDSATTGAAQLVYKSFLRTLSVEGLREAVMSGGAPMAGIVAYADTMRRYQGIEGLSLIDSKDTLEVQTHSALSGMPDLLLQFGQQLSGALQIPLVRFFGQSPAGLSASGESDIRTYYDGITQKQQRELFHGVHLGYRLMAASEGIPLPPNFNVGFKPLWELSETEKADYADKTTKTVTEAKEAGLISDQVALQELRQASRISGVFSNITDDLIAAADATVEDPIEQQQMEALLAAGAEPGAGGGDTPALPGLKLPGGKPPSLPQLKKPEEQGGKTGPNGQTIPLGALKRLRKPLQLEAPAGGKADPDARQGDKPPGPAR
jgi:phage-related protein (TIGR01555 family)